MGQNVSSPEIVLGHADIDKASGAFEPVELAASGHKIGEEIIFKRQYVAGGKHRLCQNGWVDQVDAAIGQAARLTRT